MQIVPKQLQLAEGIQEINKCYYYKDENGIVTVTAAIQKSTPFESTEVVATLPEGYWPDSWVELPATFGAETNGPRFAGTSSLDSYGNLCIIFDSSVQPNWAYIQFSYFVG